MCDGMSRLQNGFAEFSSKRIYFTWERRDAYAPHDMEMLHYVPSVLLTSWTKIIWKNFTLAYPTESYVNIFQQST